jgi:hypothetical protein
MQATGTPSDGTVLPASIASSGNFSFPQVTINESGADVDFRVESDTNTHAIFLNAGNSRVGINTSTPTGDLEISGSLGLIVGNASGSGKLFADGGSTKVGSKTNHRLDLITNDTQRVSIDTSGNIGIGTTSPKTLSGQTHLTINQAATGTQVAGIALRIGNADGGTIVSYPSNNEGLRLTTFNADKDITFFKNISGSDTELMRIETSGNVGIGETSPAANLHVKEGDSGTTPDSNRDTLFIENNGNSGLTIGTPNSNSGYLSFADPEDDNAGQIIYRHASNSMSLFTAGTERMRIDSSGELLIGKTVTTLSTDGSRISPDGSIKLSRSSTSTNGATASGASLTLINPSATDNNFSNIGGYNSNSLVTSQIDFINVSHSSRHGAMAFMVHNGSSMPEMMRITKDGRVGIGTSSPTSLLTLNHATAPFIRLNDSNTTKVGIGADGGLSYIFSQDGNPLVFTTSTGTAFTERMRIDTSGNVGIGTTSPGGFNPHAQELVVHDADGTCGITISTPNDTVGRLAFADPQDDNVGEVRYTHSANTLEFTVNAAERMRIDSSGNVGLGVTSVSDARFRIKGANNNTSAFDDGLMVTSNNETVYKKYSWMGIETKGGLSFHETNSGSLVETMRIDTSGNVGIGTTNGSARLMVARDIADSASNNFNNQTVILTGTIGGNSTNNRTGLYFAPYNASNQYSPSAITCTAGSNYASILKFFVNAAGNGTGHVDSYERMRITSLGRVGIGTSSPADRLHVNGGDLVISTATAPNVRIVKADDSSGTNATRAFFGICSGANNYMNGTADGDTVIVGAEGGDLLIGFGNNVKFFMLSDGRLRSAASYNNTTSSSANMSMPNNTGEFFRSTSSRKYKDNIVTLTDELADKILNCRPVSYTSTCAADDKTKIFYGMIAEEVHEVDSSLVLYDNEPETPVPEGVQYDRFVPALINLVKRQKAQIETLEAKVAALEAA